MIKAFYFLWWSDSKFNFIHAIKSVERLKDAMQDLLMSFTLLARDVTRDGNLFGKIFTH